MNRSSPDPSPPTKSYGLASNHSWLAKFRNSFRGVLRGFTNAGQPMGRNSFLVHVPVAMAVLFAGWWRELDLAWMVVLIGCIALVWTAELFNTSIECLSRSITDQPNANIRDALDIASGGVLVASGFAALLGVIALVFG
ncbi:MAG: diacylglycerol kinase [Planctomycetota bacterium]